MILLLASLTPSEVKRSVGVVFIPPFFELGGAAVVVGAGVAGARLGANFVLIQEIGAKISFGVYRRTHAFDVGYRPQPLLSEGVHPFA